MRQEISRVLLCVAAGALCGFAAQQGLTQPSQPEGETARTEGRCSMSDVAATFANDPNTKVRLVKAFTKGEPLTLDGQADAQKAPNDLCMVKLTVGPGNPGPAGAPSTSEGIGIEVWLPSPDNWNGRIHNIGSGGLDGVSEVSSLTKLGALSMLYSGWPIRASGVAGAASAINDSGHVAEGPGGVANASFLMNPDGGINEALARDYGSRAIHETAVKTKMLVQAYYGRSANKAYFTGCSNGGRQALKSAQDYPGDFDGILSGAPAINLLRGQLYPQIVVQRDLGGKPMTPAQLSLVSSAAVSACDKDATGRHIGYIAAPAMCRYNPEKDANVLCASDGGRNRTVQCVTRAQAKAINKIWYGQTIDGSVPDPAMANGYSTVLGPKQVHFGLPRGTNLSYPLTPAQAASSNEAKFADPIGTHLMAVLLGDPSIAGPSFQNATGKGADGWKKLTYAELARLSLARNKLAFLNADNPDLSGFQAKGGKLLSYHGIADEALPIQVTNRYYEAVAKETGGYDATKTFYRYYTIPAFGHCFNIGQVDGLAGVSPKADPPLPWHTPYYEPTMLYDRLVAWVEQGHAPEEIVLKSASGKSSRPICPYPEHVRYKGGDPDKASSYACGEKGRGK